MRLETPLKIYYSKLRMHPDNLVLYVVDRLILENVEERMLNLLQQIVIKSESYLNFLGILALLIYSFSSRYHQI